MDAATHVFEAFPCADPLRVAAVAANLLPHLAATKKMSVHRRREPGRRPGWICRWRERDPASGQSVQRSYGLASEPDARALQVLLSQQRAEHQAERVARQNVQRWMKELRDSTLARYPLGPRALRRGHRAFRAAQQEGFPGVLDFVFRQHPQGAPARPGRPTAIARLVQHLPQQRPWFPRGYRGTGNKSRYGFSP